MHAIRRVLLKVSLAGMVVVSAATGCGGDDDEDVGNTGNGGDESGGAAAAGTDNGSSAGEPSGAGAVAGGPSNGEGGAAPGGTPSGGAAPAEGGEGGAGNTFGGAPAGTAGAGTDGSAIAKFCNTLGGDPITLRLEIGEGINKVSFTATSGECAPEDGESCTAIPSGQAVLVSLYDAANDAVPLQVRPQKISDGQAWIFSVEKKGVNTSWTARAVQQGVMCEDVTFSDL